MAMMRPDVKSHLPERAKTRRNKRGQKISSRNGGAAYYIGRRTTNAQMPGHPFFGGAGAPHLGAPNVPGGRQTIAVLMIQRDSVIRRVEWPGGKPDTAAQSPDDASREGAMGVQGLQWADPGDWRSDRG